MAVRWKDDLCPSCKTYICFTDGYAVCKICKLSIDNKQVEEEQLLIAAAVPISITITITNYYHYHYQYHY